MPTATAQHVHFGEGWSSLFNLCGAGASSFLIACFSQRAIPACPFSVRCSDPLLGHTCCFLWLCSGTQYPSTANTEMLYQSLCACGDHGKLSGPINITSVMYGVSWLQCCWGLKVIVDLMNPCRVHGQRGSFRACTLKWQQVPCVLAPACIRNLCLLRRPWEHRMERVSAPVPSTAPCSAAQAETPPILGLPVNPAILFIPAQKYQV